jgi:NADH-ubiquinone oxidoreductase chain 5
LVCGTKDVQILKVILIYRPHICHTTCFILLSSSTSFISRGIYLFLINKSFILDLNIISSNSLEFNYILLLDIISLTFIGVVTLIASCVVYYRKDYIKGDENINRFIILVLMFVISIIALILRPNMIRILLG